MKRKTWMCALALASLPGGGVAQDVVPDETLTLRFGWSPGLAGTVDLEQRIVRRGQGPSDTDIQIRTSYGLDVSEHPDGLLVSYTDGRLVSMDSENELAPDNPLETLYGALAGVQSGYVVSPEGELLEMLGAEEAAAAFQQVLGPWADSARAIPEMSQWLQAFEGMLTPDAMVNAAADHWGSLVWSWAGEELGVDLVYEFETEEPSPLLPDVLIPMRYEFGFLERVPCTDEATEVACVRVEIRSYPDPDTATRLLQDFLERMAASMGGGTVAVHEFEQENLVTVVTRPESLIPYSLVTSKSISGSMTIDGEINQISRLDHSTWSFRYGSGH